MKAVRRETLPVLIAEEITRDIAKGSLKPGERLPTETELSNIMGVGRPTIREALRFLEGKGLIEIKLSGGAFVMNSNKVNEISWIIFQEEKSVELLHYELLQLEEEGKVVDETIKQELKLLENNYSLEAINQFSQKLRDLKKREGYPYDEPMELEDIRRKSGGDGGVRVVVPDKPLKISENELRDHLYGAWLGRCVGCLLGKPVEGWPRQEIERFLKATDTYPLDNYFLYKPEVVQNEAIQFHRSAKESTRGNIEYFARDDDLDYTILNLDILLKNGLNFTTEDVGESWLDSLPFQKVYTAERQAYLNYAVGLRPPDTAMHNNPFREWIGAQIRADVFGYVAPGNPKLAAELAYKDAKLSHTKNGLYGEMFIAAVIAAAFSTNDVKEVLRIGLTQVPGKSRLYELVEKVMHWCDTYPTWEETWEKVEEAYGKYDWVHTLPNLAYVIMGLLYGGDDFRKAIAIAVMCGRDTDCTGATTGSIVGALKGKNIVPKDLVEPMHDRMKSIVYGFTDVTISGMVEKTADFVLENR